MALKSLSDIKKQVDDIVKNESFNETLYNSIDKLLRSAVAIKETKGETGWSAKVLNDDGSPIFNPSEQSHIETIMTPLIPLVLYLLGEIPQSSLPQYGGQQEDIPSMNAIEKRLTNGVKTLNKTMNDFSKNGEIVRFESSPTDLRPFLPLAATPLALLSQIPIPPRAFVFFAYMALDLARVFLAAPYPIARSVMSIVVAIVDFMSGDWKKSLLSLAGVYSENSMIVGFYGKMFLSVFNLLSPDLQENMTFGVFDVAKSLAVGTILQVFQTFAPEVVRAEASLAFDNLKSNLLDPESKAIEEAGLPPRKDYYREITYEDIQNLQTIMKDPVRNCSEEFLRTIAVLSTNTLMKNLLTLLGIPTSSESVEHMCDKKIEDYVHTLAKDRVSAEQEEKVEEQLEEKVQEQAQEQAQEQVEKDEEQPILQKPENVIIPQTLPVEQKGGRRKNLRRALLFQS